MGISKIAVTTPLTLANPAVPARGSREIAMGNAEWIYRFRQRRARYIPEVSDMFHDPVWDILLDLFVQTRSENWVSVTSACFASAVPSTTALRILGVLVQRGVVERIDDPDDGRRALVALAASMRARMEAMLSESVVPG